LYAFGATRTALYAFGAERKAFHAFGAERKAFHAFGAERKVFHAFDVFFRRIVPMVEQWSPTPTVKGSNPFSPAPEDLNPYGSHLT
jgi:hypothetical protein